MAVSIKLAPKLELRLRVIVLHDAIRELAVACGATDELQRILHECVVNRPILKYVAFQFLDGAERVVGKLTITVDWETHRIRASSDDGKTIELDLQRSVCEQVGAMVEVVQDLVIALKKQVPGVRLEWLIGFVDDVTANPEKLKEARRVTGTKAAEARPWSNDASFSPDLVLGGSTAMLPELELRLEIKKPS